MARITFERRLTTTPTAHSPTLTKEERMTPTTERTGPKAGPGTIAAATRKFDHNSTEQTRTTRRNKWRNRIHLARIARRVSAIESRIDKIESTFETHLANHSEGDR